MCRLVYLDSARDDLKQILTYITRESGNLSIGRAFVNTLRQQCVKLAALSGTLGTPRPELRPDLRSFPVQGYVILFRYQPDTFEIVNIIEGHRDFDKMFP